MREIEREREREREMYDGKGQRERERGCKENNRETNKNVTESNSKS